MKIGFATPVGLWESPPERRAEMLDELYKAGVDHVFMADHVSFRDGSGTDGFVEIAGLSQLHPTLGVMISVYLLPLRHPLPVARQLATVNKIAPGRVLLGVGIGGEDRHEIEQCGVDPRTRGRLMNEAMPILRRLMTGEPVSWDGEFFQLDRASIRPEIEPRIPIVVGGRSNAALERAGRFGDGWIGAWCSPRRYVEALGLVATAAEEVDRGQVDWLHGYQPWVGVAGTRDEARRLVAESMESFYRVPFERFERYVPFGRPDEVVAALAPYVEAGCSLLNLKIVAASNKDSVSAVEEISAALRGRATILPSSGKRSEGKEDG